jgi:signal transduction histidine kinase/ActR/RegA family two-component response regulator
MLSTKYEQLLANAAMQLEQKINELSLVRRVTDALVRSQTVCDGCEHLIDIILQETNCENCSILLLDGEQYILSAARGQMENIFTNRSDKSGFSKGEGIAGQVAENQECIRIDDVTKDIRFVLRHEQSTTVVSLLCAPLVDRGDCIGILNLSTPEVGAFSMEQERMVTIIAHQAALFLANIRLHEQVTKSLEELKCETNERRHLEAQLLQSQKMESIGRLAGGIAHDFNNTLGTIMMNASLLQSKYPDAFCFEGQAANDIINGAKRGAELTSQLLGFARGGKYWPVLLDMNETIREAVNVSEKMFEKSIDVHYDFTEHLQSVIADKNQMHQVFTNLVINAKDAMPNGGTLFFKTEYSLLDDSFVQSNPEMSVGEYIKVTIRDTGTGMPQEVLDNIFEPFFTTKDIGKGTGLGLAMVYGIINNHGGSVHCDSVPGTGTTFILFLPVAEDDIIEENTDEEAVTQDATILIVDDEPCIRNSLQRLLTKMGYSVFTAKDGAEALDVYSEKGNSINLILLDMIMPVMTGVTTYRELRKLNPDVKVLLISGFSKDDRANEIIREGVLGFLQKPFQFDELSQAICDALAPVNGE